MGSGISQQQSVIDAIAPFEDALSEVQALGVDVRKESPGEVLYKKYEKEYMSEHNPLRFYNSFRLFYSIRKM